MSKFKPGMKLTFSSGAYECYEIHEAVTVVKEFDLDEIKKEYLHSGTNDAEYFPDFYQYLLHQGFVVPFTEQRFHLGDWELGDKGWKADT